MERHGDTLEKSCGSSSQSGRSSASTLWPLPCSLTSLLNMNCRARAEGLARSVSAKIRYSATRDDMVPLHQRMEGRSVSVDATCDQLLLSKPLHVVTSEPTMHIDYSPTHKCSEEDSDLHYDFGLVTPEDGQGLSVEFAQSSDSISKKSSLSDHEKRGKIWADSKGESSDRPESGCVTSVTSPVMFRDDMMSSTLSSPSDDVLSPTNSTDLKAVREILSFTSFVEGIQGMTYSLSELTAVDSGLYCELSGADSGLYTDLDSVPDSVKFFSRDVRPDTDDKSSQNCNKINPVHEFSDSTSDDAEKFGKVTPPEGFRNVPPKALDPSILENFPKDQRRRSCDLPPKIYQQQTLRWSSPPGYRSGLTLPGGLCLALLPARAPTTETLSFKRQVAEPIKKHESQVVCSSGGFGAFRTQLCKSNRPVTSEPESDKRELSSPACVTSCMLGSPDHEAWSTEWQHNDHTAMGDLRASSSIDATLGTTAHSWHTTSTASFDAAAAATSAAAAIQPQLITAAVCGQPAQRDEASLSSSECDSRPSPESQPVCDSLKRAQLTGPDISEPTIATMRDECEPSVPSFSRRRRYKVREGQSKSSGASCSNVDTLNAKVNDGTPLSASEHSSEPSSPGSMRDCDSSEPTSPLNAETNLPNSWPVAETENASSASGACSVPISVDENHDEAGKVSNADDDAQDEEDVPAVVEGKFKHLLQYKETVRKLSYAAEDAYDPSITTVIQLDENELSEPEEDVSLHDEVDQHELDEKLNRLQIETPEMNVQQPSDESSRDSSADPVEEDLSLRIKRSSSLKCGKTPPGTPGTKKIVRFADSLGLDLAECRTFLEGVPNVPKSAFGDLRIAKAEDESENSPSSSQLFLSSCNSNRYTAIAQKKMLMPLFQQPCVLPGFLDRVRANKVSLETISVGDDMSVRGYVRVLNLDFHKHVVVRYTFDGWRNFHEATASYVHGSCDGFSDKFSFLLWGSFLQENGSLTFCIRYTAGGSEFWDNNRGSNYVLQCYTNQIRRQLHQQALHQPADNNLSHGGGSYSKHFGSVFQNSPPTPSENWTGTFF